MSRKNLLSNLPIQLSEELAEDLLCTDRVRIERIISTGQVSAPDAWYDQEENEWIVLLAGAARLEIRSAEGTHFTELRPGDHYYLPAHLLHRVDWTDTNQPTVWLAIWWGQ